MTAREDIKLYGTLADLKEIVYKNTLAITALLELLVDKGVITAAEMAERAQKLDAASD